MILQYIIVGIAVLLAAYMVLKRFLPIGKKGHKNSCSGCSACSAISAPEEK